MQSLHIETTCTENGVITLRDLPIHEGDFVEAIIIARSSPASVHELNPLHGRPVEYIRPFESVAQSDWEALG